MVEMVGGSNHLRGSKSKGISHIPTPSRPSHGSRRKKLITAFIELNFQRKCVWIRARVFLYLPFRQDASFRYFNETARNGKTKKNHVGPDDLQEL